MKKPIENTKTFQWKGLHWNVDNYQGGPGPNNFSPSNVSIQPDGIHLKVTHVNGKWYCASIQSVEKQLYGTYRCVVKGRPDLMDPEIVLAMYNYGNVDGTNETDIELSRWNDPKDASPLNYTVYPPMTGPNEHQAYPMVLNSNYSTHRFTWKNDRIDFLSQQGARPTSDISSVIRSATISISPNIVMNIRFNMWLYDGALKGTLNGKGAEMVITDFSYTPL